MEKRLRTLRMNSLKNLTSMLESSIKFFYKTTDCEIFDSYQIFEVT